MGYWSQIREMVMKAGLGVRSFRNVSPAKWFLRSLQSRSSAARLHSSSKDEDDFHPAYLRGRCENPRYDKYETKNTVLEK